MLLNRSSRGRGLVAPRRQCPNPILSVRPYAPRTKAYRQAVETPDAADDPSETPSVANPRQVHARLDEFVIAQDRAKRILSVAVHNHQLRVLAVLRARRESERRSEFEEMERERREAEVQAQQEAAMAPEGQQAAAGAGPSASATARGKRVSPQAVEASIQLDEEAARRNADASSAVPRRRLQRKSTEDTASSPDDFPTFSPSYPPSRRFPTSSDEESDAIHPTTSRLLRQRLAILTDREKAIFAKRRKSGESASSSAPSPARDGEMDILSDFLGQQPGFASSSTSKSSFTAPEEAPWQKSNILLIGPTGTGKSLLARTVARQLDVPYSESCATTMTSSGYVGDDVESAVIRLLQEADGDVEKAGRGVIFIDEVDKIARRPGEIFSKDVSGEGVQQALLRMLEGTQIVVSDKGEGMPSSSQSRGRTRAGLPGFNGNQKANEPVVVDTTNILFILAGAFVGLEKVVQGRVAKGSIGFNARIQPESSPTAGAPSTPSLASLGISTTDASQPQTFLPFFSSTSPSAAPPDLLDLVEPSDLNAYGLIPEFVGRIPTVAALKTLSEDDMLRVLTEPKNALVKQYEALFEMSGVELRFTTPALREVAKAALGKNTGARGLRRILENLLLDSMYAAPGSSIRYILIDRAVARGEKPAVFFSRGQKHIFQNAFEAENDEHAASASSAPAPADDETVAGDEKTEEVAADEYDEERRQPQRRAATG